MLDSANEVVGLIVGLIAIGGTVAAGIKSLRKRKAKQQAVTPAQDESPPSFAGLGARPAVNTEGFLAREAELARLNQLVADGKRVIWVTGPTQAGKTWLVSRWVEDSGDLSVFARFGMDERPTLDGLLEGINSFLCRRGEQGFDAACKAPDASLSQRVAELVRVLGGKRWIILLDSFEQVGDDVDIRGLVERLQSDLRESLLLIGSRAMLEWGDASAELPLRGIGEKAGFEILAEQEVAEEHREALYRKVDGLPGALLRIAMLVRDRGLSAATRELKGTAAEVGEQLLTETFDALSEGAQRLWAGICLLPAPITREAAREMCGRSDFDPSWDELAQWKLLQMTEDRAELHPLARAAGEKRLDGMAAWKRACGQRIATHYADFAKTKRDDRAAVEAELENLLAAARLAFQHEQWELLWAMGYALWEPLMYAGRWTAREDLLRLCYDGARRAEDKQRRGDFAHNLAMAFSDKGNLKAAEPLYLEGLAVQREAGQRKDEANTLLRLGTVARQRGKLEEAEALYNQTLKIKQEVGDRPGEASTLLQLGTVAQERGKLEEAEDLYKQSLAIAREGEVGDRPGEATTLHQLGIVAQRRGKLEEAEDLYNQSLEIKREVGDRPGEAQTLHQLGRVAEIRGKLEAAGDFYNQSLEIEREVGNRPGEAISYETLALLAEEQGDLRVAVEWMETAHRMFEEMGLAEVEIARKNLDRLRKLLEEG